MPFAGPPRGAWVSPDDGAVVPGPIQFAVRAAPARPGGATVSAVRFMAAPLDIAGDVACMAPSPDPDGVFACTWDPTSVGLPSGPIQVSFDVADQVGQVSRNAGGSRVVTYQPPAPTEIPTASPTPIAVPSSPTPTRAPEPLPPEIPIWTMMTMEASDD
jgi:hypothetical protein